MCFNMAASVDLELKKVRGDFSADRHFCLNDKASRDENGGVREEGESSRFAGGRRL